MVETSAPRFATDTRSSVLQREPIKDVKRTATPAGARGERPRKPHATEEQNAEELGAETKSGRRNEKP